MADEYDLPDDDDGEEEITEEEAAERQKQLQILMEGEESSDEDSVPDRPEFDLELKWFRVYPDKAERVEYTKIKCIVKVRITDTVGDLRKKVKEFTELSNFKLLISETGEELLQDPAELDDYEEYDNEKQSKNSDDDNDESYDNDDDNDDDYNDEEDGEMSSLLQSSKERKDKEKEDKNKEILLYDKRTLSLIGIKEPPPPKDEKAEKKDDDDDDDNDDQGEKGGGDGGDKKIDASFLPKKDENDQKAQGKENQRDDNVQNKGDGGALVAAGKGDEDNDNKNNDGNEMMMIEEEFDSITIEIEEIDDPLDSRMFLKQESSEVLYQRALNAVNKKWWDRAADGNLDLVKEMWKTEPRTDLLQINWRNPDNHERTALMVASFRGQSRTAKWLVKHKKARVNGSDDIGCTALNLAARGGCPKIVKFLLENKAKANVPDSNGWTAAVWALTMGHLEVLQTMADMGVGLQELGRAAPFESEHMSATTLMPLPCVRYKADQAVSRNELARKEMEARAKAHALKQEQMRADKEAELLGMQEKLKITKLAEYRHRFMRDARENWHMHDERIKPIVKAERKKNKLLAKQAAETAMFD